MYYIVYKYIMIKHLRVIFLHFGLKNRIRLSVYEFYSWVVWPIFYPPKNLDQYFKFNSIFKLLFSFSAAISLWFPKDERVYLDMCSFQPALNGSFRGRRFILPCQDEYLKTRRKFTFGASRHRMTTWSYKCSLSWYVHTTIVHNPLVFTDESKPTCVYVFRA